MKIGQTKEYRKHLIDEDLAGEGREGIKSGRPPPHPNLPPFSWSLHNNIPKNQEKKSRTKKSPTN
jgi:hypothetical protein